MTAKDLQNEKIKVELQISLLLTHFNILCVENDFQIEKIETNFNGKDSERSFDLDITIV